MVFKDWNIKISKSYKIFMKALEGLKHEIVPGRALTLKPFVKNPSCFKVYECAYVYVCMFLCVCGSVCVCVCVCVCIHALLCVSGAFEVC